MELPLPDFRKTLVQVLKHAGKHADYRWMNEKAKQADKIYSRIVGLYAPVKDETALMALLGDTKPRHLANLVQSKAYLYLKPIRAEQRVFLPVLGLECDFTQRECEVRVYIALFYLEAPDNLDSPVKSVAFRFEMPEGIGLAEPGKHDYFHAQPTEAFDRTRKQELIHGCLSPVPTDLPTFSLDIRHPIEMIVSIMLALYGARESDWFLGLPDRLMRRVRVMLERVVPLRSYWEAKSDSRQIYIVTRRPEKEMKEELQKRKWKVVGRVEAKVFHQCDVDKTYEFFG